MEDSKYKREVKLHCPTCGSKDFEFEENIDDGVKGIKCISCNRIFSKNELIEENSKNIEKNIEDIGDDIIKDLGKLFDK